ncbi:hypothetical protein SODG_003916 [Sodalis praecaptivus]
MEQPDIEHINAYLLGLQETICAALTAVDGGAVFHEDLWQRAEGAADGREYCARAGSSSRPG